jgi:uncharacterized protein
MGCKAIHLTGLALFAVLAAGATPPIKPDTRIVEAAAQQDMANVRALVKRGVNVNGARPDSSTALLWASHWDDLAIADLLLHAGAKVNAANDLGVTPLDLAAENASIGMVQKLLSAGADPNIAQTGGLTALMIAAHTGNVEVVKALVEHKANVQAATKETKNTALMWAVSDQFPDIVKVLIEARADVHASAANGMTALLYAAQNGDMETAKTLIAAGVKVNETGSDGTHPLPFAIVRGQGAFALFLLDQGADPNGGLGGIRALHAAAASANSWLTAWNAAHPAGGAGGARGRGMQVGGRGLNPAMRLRLVKALLAHGADPNARATTSGLMMTYIGYPRKGAFDPFECGTGDMRGATPLWAAANAAAGNQGQIMENTGMLPTDGYADIIRVLLEAGADQRLTTDDGTTPLMAAAGLGGGTFAPGLQRGYRTLGAEEAVKLLVEAGGDVNAVNEADFTALHGATMRGLDEVIQYLVDHGANINARDFRGRTPYRIAEGAKQSFQFQAYPETAEFLKKLGANTKLGIPGTVQERAPREVASAGN